MELNDNVSELKDSIGEVLVTITPEMCRQVMLSVRRPLQLCVQSGCQYLEQLCEVANLRVRQRRTPICPVTGPLYALMLKSSSGLTD